MASAATIPPAGGDQDASHMLRSVIWVEAAIGTLVVALRFFTRAYVAHNLGWDDVIMFVTWVSCTGVGGRKEQY